MPWECSACTFVNAEGTKCSVCSALKKSVSRSKKLSSATDGTQPPTSVHPAVPLDNNPKTSAQSVGNAATVIPNPGDHVRVLYEGEWKTGKVTRRQNNTTLDKNYWYSVEVSFFGLSQPCQTHDATPLVFGHRSGSMPLKDATASRNDCRTDFFFSRR